MVRKGVDGSFRGFRERVVGESHDLEGDPFMAPSYGTPFDDLEPFAVLVPDEVARRLGVTARSVRRAIARV
jgi:hypothetical protein